MKLRLANLLGTVSQETGFLFYLGFFAKVNSRNKKKPGFYFIWEKTRFLGFFAKVNARNKKKPVFYFIWGFSQRLTQETRFLETGFLTQEIWD